MIDVSIATDTDTYLPPFGAEDTARLITVREKTTVNIASNIDGATITLGYEDSTGAFKGYAAGDITADENRLVNHGIGIRLMVNTNGIGANPVKLQYSSS